MSFLEALLNLKNVIEINGGQAKLIIQLEDESTYQLFKENLTGIFNPTDVSGEFEGLDGIKFWKES